MRAVRTKKAFTIVELLIAIAILGIIMTVCFGTIVFLIGVQQKSDTAHQVQDEARSIINYVRQDIKKSERMDLVSGKYIVLHFLAPEADHTYKIDTVAGNITLTKIVGGTNRTYRLNSSNVKIEKIGPDLDLPIFQSDNCSDCKFLDLSNLKLVSTLGDQPYQFEIATAITPHDTWSEANLNLPVILNIPPVTAIRGTPITNVIINGSNFSTSPQPTAQLKHETFVIDGIVTAATSTQLTVDFPNVQPDAYVGNWDVYVTNSDGNTGSLVGAFPITSLAPTLSSVYPIQGVNDQAQNSIQIDGANFYQGAAVKLVRKIQDGIGNESDITATEVNVTDNYTRILCKLNLSGKESGEWWVDVTNADGQTVRYGSPFIIYNP